MTKPIPHYSSFGSLISNRSWSDVSRVYRYGFNGKEKDFETSSDNYDFGARIYDGRLGRWLSVDPLMKIYPSSSPYSGNGNSPIWLIDIDGCRILIQSIAQIGNINYSSCYEYRDGKLYSQNPETGIFDIEYAPIEGEYAYTALNALNIICGTPTGLKLVNDLQTNEQVITIKNIDENHKQDMYRFSDLNPDTHDDNTIYTDFSDEILPVQKMFSRSKYEISPGWIILAHELAHAYDDVFNLGFSKVVWFSRLDHRSWRTQNYSTSEIFACHLENRIRAEAGLKLRTHYTFIDDNSNKSGDPTTKLINYNGESLFFNKVIGKVIYKSDYEIEMDKETGSFDEETTKETFYLEKYKYGNNSGEIETHFTTKME